MDSPMATATTSATSADAHTSRTSSPRPLQRKHKNSFYLFANASVSSDASAEDLSKASIPEHHEEDPDNEPLWHKLLLMPLLSISFILSLCLVERSERARRSSEHPHSPPQNESVWSTFTLQNWLDPEPYQNPDDTTWQDADSADGAVPHTKTKQWFMRKKHRKMSKMALTEAFERRGTVLVTLLTVMCVSIVGVGWVVWRVYHGLISLLYA
jgi:hypothetical protein